MFKRAKAMEKRLEKIDRLEKPQLKGRKMKLELETEIRGGDDVLFVENLSKRFEDLNLFQDLNFELHRTDKAAIIGDNGTGKSTILRIIMGEITADRGQVRIGTNVYPAYYRQEFEGFNPGDDLITALQRETAVTNSKARDMLASFLFTGEDVFKKVKQLSGGEKSRLRLLQLMSGNYNFLILDEPTNHLDLASREVLEEALKDYSGTVLIVSHDRYFLDKVIDYIYELENQELNKYFGDYSYYKQKKKNEISEQQDLDEQEDKSEGKLDYEAQKEARSREQKRQKRLEEIEVEIEALEKNLSDLESQMTAEENINDFELLQELKDKYEQQNSRLETLYQEWEKIV
jgi:ATP-binding cassette subfamily F protein 3